MEGAAYIRVFMGQDSIRPYYEVRDYTIKGTLVRPRLRQVIPYTAVNPKEYFSKTPFLKRHLI